MAVLLDIDKLVKTSAAATFLNNPSSKAASNKVDQKQQHLLQYN